MHLNLTQNLKLSQELRLTPVMIQSMEILQLQVMQLQARINQELQENPVLELIEEVPENIAPAPVELDPEREVRVDQSSESFSELESLERNLESFESLPRSSRLSVESSDAKHEALQNTAAPEVTLQEHLDNQLRMMKLSEREYEIANLIVYNIERDGYLRVSMPDLQMAMEEEISPPPTIEEIEEVIFFLQKSCEPVGVVARSLKECLQLQANILESKPIHTDEIIEYHLEDVLNNRLPYLSRAMNVNIEEIKKVKDFLHFLNPKPGLLFGPAHNSRVTPDIIIEEDSDGSFRVRLENSLVPEIRISSDYRKMLDEKNIDAETLGYVKGKVDSAKCLIDAIHQRQMTILKITDEIINVQGQFLKEGIEHLKCLRMQEIADRVGVHVSTVSRAISGKYVQCPQGILPMKKFFTGGSSTEDGVTESHQVVHNRVRDLINGEDKADPYSDDEIVRRLKESGISLARRTVAKYRKIMNIPSARLRKEY